MNNLFITKTTLFPIFLQFQNPNPNFPQFPPKSNPPKPPLHTIRNSPYRIHAQQSVSDIDMVQTKDGIYKPKQKKVVILWDLDNKPPRGPPYEAAMALKQLASSFGDLVDVSAYANRHAFIHLPQWVLDQRRERKQVDYLERKGLSFPVEEYKCGVCGRKCKTNMDLKKHFKQLHEREREKKMSRLKSLKGKKRQKFKERQLLEVVSVRECINGRNCLYERLRLIVEEKWGEWTVPDEWFISGNDKYNEAARSLLTPRTGYGLASELRRAGVFVKTVEDKPQAADWALKKQMQHTMSRGIDWMFLISDDSDFSDMVRKASESSVGTVVVGDSDRALGRHADVWVPWVGVENGEISEKDLVPRSKRTSEMFDTDDGLFSLSHFDEGIDGDETSFDSVMDELAAMRSEITSVRVSAFSEEEPGGDDWVVSELGDDDYDDTDESSDDDDDDRY